MDKRLGIAILVTIISITIAVFYIERGGTPMLADETYEELVKGSPQELKIKVNGLSMGEIFPKQYTCDGEDKPPSITITGIPENSKSLVIIVYDPDAPYRTFLHWIAYTNNISEKLVFPTEQLVEGINDFGRKGYGGPCPPRGHGVHRYFFLVVAVDKELNLGEGFSLKQLLAQLKDHIIAYGYTYNTYERR
jgi:Raf kinase inhibitor-like YbhB/YbcL family protein